ncbi:MAG: hypothetical protein A2268_16000 [Candidatus Raymondbacteria bacterium RifOxyA12_full_50_37]|uniref:TadE-like domain-containing protein n=1 Tax=Candidatus Raymondbacteria bacterium RIFOXYD12_FULL_49_13 TaxID=1817890 RepID=A0A1F7F5L0_UNCRA|nr:MAG: hypothetical protein A2268_16000 [Candidatus Raymondbacteria bacterium RifOxyA12_full_50_37]OGJ89251.1 MAG: hypothetical protein A2248_18895 [Candidatus Raymondbacteria bacterium RIFOXYA2_FULL_49_16]OGJ97417.1 MAG: hypothetical protein A2453_03815 [Candidatus Raymondbacteria bacterium RIFOXYC2_FULL_50_21]OGK01931.1 MAG: hypothetical protein A2519_05700 [Candidatus Raymondbacteria bacterium RIFOXYD12_FULL_49_13]OGK03801.1 MAG: hypothetical protein A2350_11440 [Candidatus Raymondbacteria 
MRGSKGQAAIEFAIVIPFLLFFLFAATETGLLYTAKHCADLGTFRAARSFRARRQQEAASQALWRTIAPLARRDTPESLSYISIFENSHAVEATTVFLYRPVFPVLPLARLLGNTFLPEKHAAAVTEASAVKSWEEKLRSHVAIVSQVTLEK